MNSEKLNFAKQSESEIIQESKLFYDKIKRRRTVRDFSTDAIPEEIIQNAIMSAGTAPSGANMQPWHFSVTTDPKIKYRIRVEAEKEERKFYDGRAPKEWLEALAPLGTNENKPFLETAPVLIGIFLKQYTEDADGQRQKNYYPSESVGIACGMLISALHFAGLATLTHTPSPMKFLNEIFQRPASERAYLLLVVGYPTDNCEVPVITKKSFADITSFVGEI
ncbi:MAG: nitroreductase family protein [Chloroflexota bacterium]|nr:nitroreductase family protein [Chloroflexota bacterium]